MYYLYHSFNPIDLEANECGRLRVFDNILNLLQAQRIGISWNATKDNKWKFQNDRSDAQLFLRCESDNTGSCTGKDHYLLNDCNGNGADCIQR